jgi:ribosomal protein S11
MDPKKAAQAVQNIHKEILTSLTKIQKSQISLDKTSAYRAANSVDELRSHLQSGIDSITDTTPCSPGGCQNRIRR